MNFPIPNDNEVKQLQALYWDKVGVTLTHEQAFEVLSQLVQFLYLTEYEPIRPLRS